MRSSRAGPLMTRTTSHLLGRLTACTLLARDGMVVRGASERVLEARRANVELLRSRHDYVAATLPWDESRLGLCLEPLRRTAVAATYRIAGQRRADGSCQRGPLAAR